MKVILLLALVAFVCADDAVNEVTKRTADFFDALNTGNPDAVAAFYVPTDGTIVYDREKPAKGREAVKKFYSTYLGSHGSPKVLYRQIRGGGDLVAVKGRYTVGGKKHSVLYVWRKIDGNWLISVRSVHEWA